MPSAHTLIDDQGEVSRLIKVWVGEDPALSAIATSCGGQHYHVSGHQELLHIPSELRIVVNIEGRAKLTRDERKLKAIGKLKTERSSRTI